MFNGNFLMKLVKIDKVSYPDFKTWFMRCGWEILLLSLFLVAGVFFRVIGQVPLHGTWACPFKKSPDCPVRAAA